MKIRKSLWQSSICRPSSPMSIETLKSTKSSHFLKLTIGMSNRLLLLFTLKMLRIIHYPNNSNNFKPTMGWDSQCNLLRAAWLAGMMTLRNREWIFLIKSDRREGKITSQPKVTENLMAAASSQVLEEGGHIQRDHNRNNTDSQWTLKTSISIISIRKGTRMTRRGKRNWNMRRHKCRLKMMTSRIHRLL